MHNFCFFQNFIPRLEILELKNVNLFGKSDKNGKVTRCGIILDPNLIYPIKFNTINSNLNKIIKNIKDN